jgi:predicted dehydrogenase
LINTGKTEAIIHGTKGMIRMNTMWHIPTSVDLITNEGELQHFEFEEHGNGYEYEAAEVMRCLDAKAIQSPDFSWQHSAELIVLLKR